MSWAEVKKINSNMKVPLDKLLTTLILGGYVWTKEIGESILSVPDGLPLYITACAGGGGGSGASGASWYDGRTFIYKNGASGGRGNYVVDEKIISTADTINVVVGAGGSAGENRAQSSSGQVNVYSGAGGAGGNTSVGSLVLQGGTGGTASMSGVNGYDGTAGTPTGTISQFGGAYGNGGVGGTTTSYAIFSRTPTAGQQGIIVITWGALKFADVWDGIAVAIQNGATHGGSEE